MFPSFTTLIERLSWLIVLSVVLVSVLRECLPQKTSSSTRIQDRSLRDRFLDELIPKLTVAELVQQLHMTFADNVIGPKSQNELYDSYNGDRGIGSIHDWYPTNASQYNTLQKLNLEKMRLPIPFFQLGECLHGVGSAASKWSVFPQQLGMAASFDPDIVYRVARATATEARSMGIHACFSPVLDLAKEPRWGRTQEGYGEDMFLTSTMGVAYSLGLSKNKSYTEPDAVIPVMKHFAAHGSPQGGTNQASFLGYGMRQVKSELLVPFKAAVELGGAKGVMMSYNDIDSIPSHIHPELYQALEDWSFEGYVTADDGGVVAVKDVHRVASSDDETIAQWFNAGGQVQFYDWPLDRYLEISLTLVQRGIVSKETLQKRVRGPLGVKYDLGLFDNPYIPSHVKNTDEIANGNIALSLEAALKSIVLLENRNDTLPIRPNQQGIRKISLVGPMVDTFNYGDYTGPWGASPVFRANTIREAILEYLAANASHVELRTNWGSDTWLYHGQYPIPPYLLSSVNLTKGGLTATYFANTNFSDPVFTRTEPPNRDWGLYPPNGLPSNNFSVVWEGHFHSPYDADGWLGIAAGPNSDVRVVIDHQTHVHIPSSSRGTIMGNIYPFDYSTSPGTSDPVGTKPFAFRRDRVHHIRIEFQVWNYEQKYENVNSLNAQIQLVWNPAGGYALDQAVQASKDADLIVYVGGAGWNSDGEGGDRATLGLSPNQTALVDSLFELEKPVILILQGGRPFVLNDYYNRAAAVLNTYFPGQQAGRATAEVLFGVFNPGGRIPISIPSSIGSIPAYYNYKTYSHLYSSYRDAPTSFPKYTFGYGKSYTTFKHSAFFVKSTSGSDSTFHTKDRLIFEFNVTNTGSLAGSDVPQVYLLSRVSSVSQPTKQLVGFERIYLDPGEERHVQLELDPQRYLLTLNRTWGWEVEKGDYPFALLSDASYGFDPSLSVTITCIG